jgi:hypothetical protein
MPRATPAPPEIRNVNYGGRVVEAETTPDLENASRDYASQAGFNIDGQGGISLPDPGHAKGRSRDPRFETRMASLRMRVSSTGITPATVFNFLPIRLTVNSPSMAVRNGVDPVKGDDDFATRTWSDLDIQIIDEGELGKSPQEFHPIQIARVFEFEYNEGGVVALPCIPEDADEPKWAPTLKKHADQAVAWMLRQVQTGERLWNAPDRLQRQNVRSIHRACGERLVALKILRRLPDFCTEKRELSDVPEACAKCGTTPDSRFAVQCGVNNCGYIMNPVVAFQKRIIPEDHEALERLTRDQVKELGISDYVAETSDEYPARIKAGRPKPFSKAAERAIAAEQQLTQAPARG